MTALLRLVCRLVAHRPWQPLLAALAVALGVAVVVPNVRGSDGYGRTYLGLDLGIVGPPLGAIGNYVWFDEDSNGYQDDGERAHEGGALAPRAGVSRAPARPRRRRRRTGPYCSAVVGSRR